MEGGEDLMMATKILGATLVILACGGVGFRMAAIYRLEEKALQQFIGILDYMECELQYRLTPLPQLCRQSSKVFSGIPGRVLGVLANELESQITPDIGYCMQCALSKIRNVPPVTENMLMEFGKSVGRFDLQGQLQLLESLRQDCQRNLQEFRDNRGHRLRSYQTLGLCAGAALAILFV